MIRLCKEEVAAYATGAVTALALTLALPALFAVLGVFSAIGGVIYVWLYPGKAHDAFTKHVGRGDPPRPEK